MSRARLSPHGSLARQFGGAQDEAWHGPLRAELGDDLFAAANELANLGAQGGADLRNALLALAAACLHGGRSGSTRLPIGNPAHGPLCETFAALRVPSLVAARAFELLAADQSARGDAQPLLGARGEFKPLILDGDALCIQWMAFQEDDLGQRLRARYAEALAPFEEKKVALALHDLLARAPMRAGRAITLSDEQQRAVIAAAHQPLTVISGGPGTGKTSIVVSILRLLARLGTGPESIALAAPTGKAANRMEESIVAYLSGIGDPAAEDSGLLAVRPAPTTLHRLLGYSQRRNRFAHHAQNPLPHRMVIVDEASMIDLAMMDRLVRAVGAGAHLVLLGDAEQLPSVEAGAVLRDLVPLSSVAPARPWDALVGVAQSSEVLQAAPRKVARDSGSDDLRARGAVRLTKSYRMDESDPAGRNIFLVSQALRAGIVPPIVAAKPVSAHLREHSRAADVSFSGVELLSGAPQERDAFLHRWFRERIACSPQFAAQLGRIWPLEGNAIEASALDALSRLDAQYQSARLLCLTRTAARPSGTGRVNALLSGLLREFVGGVGDDADSMLAGAPMMMTKNDYQLGLFNGDQGLVLWSQRADESAPALRLLVRIKGTYVAHELDSLGAQLTPCWAMTVHKAQGSEFDHVALILPTDDESGGEADQLACREVVYTAMTRARRSVTVLGSATSLTQAVERSLTRWSALGDPGYWRAEATARD